MSPPSTHRLVTSGTHTGLVVMGVSGAGKSTVARLLADRLGWALAEADDFHPARNIEKMRAGTPLTDADRRPWLRAIAGWLAAWAGAGENAIVTCSALKRAYRDVLRDAGPRVRFVHLHGDHDTLARRLGGRSGHFMPPALLDSQLADLEPLAADEDGVVVDIGGTPEEVAAEALRRLGPAVTATPGP
ncbi:gluconokinase [Streptomyces aculeolatus]